MTDAPERRNFYGRIRGKTLRASTNKYDDLWDQSGLAPLPFPTQVMISSGVAVPLYVVLS